MGSLEGGANSKGSTYWILSIYGKSVMQTNYPLLQSILYKQKKTRLNLYITSMQSGVDVFKGFMPIHFFIFKCSYWPKSWLNVKFSVVKVCTILQVCTRNIRKDHVPQVVSSVTVWVWCYCLDITLIDHLDTHSCILLKN